MSEVEGCHGCFRRACKLLCRPTSCTDDVNGVPGMQGQQTEEAERDDVEGQAAFMAAQSSPGQHQRAGARQSMREYFAGQLMQHEWMTDAPEDLGQNWWEFSAWLDGLQTLGAGCTSDCYFAQNSFLSSWLSCLAMQDSPASPRGSAMPAHSFQGMHSELLQKGRDNAPLSLLAPRRLCTDWQAPTC